MIERPSPKDYSVLSPLQRNQELRRFYEALPRPNGNGILFPENQSPEDIVREFFNDRRRRGNSDYHRTMMHNIQELLKQSLGTPTFRDIVFRSFWSGSAGTLDGREDKLFPEDNQLAHLIDIDNSEGAGIFDKDRVKEIERDVFKEHMQFALVLMNHDAFEISKFQHKSKYSTSDVAAMNLSVWGQQFLDTHSEEP